MITLEPITILQFIIFVGFQTGLRFSITIVCNFLLFFRRARGSKNPVKSLLARKDLVIREEDLKSSEDKENRNKVKNVCSF